MAGLTGSHVRSTTVSPAVACGPVGTGGGVESVDALGVAEVLPDFVGSMLVGSIERPPTSTECRCSGRSRQRKWLGSGTGDFRPGTDQAGSTVDKVSV